MFMFNNNKLYLCIKYLRYLPESSLKSLILEFGKRTNSSTL